MTSAAKVQSPKSVKQTGHSVAEFRAAHDKSFIVPAKIRAGLASLGECWEYEAEFLRRCGLSTTDFSIYRDQFVEFWIQTGGKSPRRVWAGTAKFAETLREMVP